MNQARRSIAFFRLAIALVIIATGSARAQSPIRPTRAERPRDILQLFDLDESVLRFYRDGEALSSDELEPTSRLLYLLPRFDAQQRHEWRIVPEDWNFLVSEPSAHRLEMYLLMGRVLHVEQRQLAPETARRFDYDTFYILEVESSIEGSTLFVCARQIPRDWPTDPRGQPVSCEALFLKLGRGRGEREELVFATDRIAWHPSQTDVEIGIGPGKTVLGRSGMDVSQLQDLSQRQPLGASDRECFYQMLWAMRRISPAAITAAVGDTALPVVRVLQHPAKEAGNVFRLRGTARRAIRIRVDDPDIRARFGIDHYYEVEFFTPLEQTLELVDARDGQKRAYRNFPITACVTELPPSMPEGDEVRQAIEVEGFFMKLWAYRSRFTSDSVDDELALPRRQVCPLLIAKSIRRVDETAPPANPWPAWAMAAMVLGTVTLTLLARWRYARTDRPLERWRRARRSDIQLTIPDVKPAEQEADDRNRPGDG